MIPAWDWPEYRLVVTIRNRALTDSFLLNGVSQAEFMEHYIDKYNADPRNVTILEMHAAPLTEESYELLEPYYPDDRKME